VIKLLVLHKLMVLILLSLIILESFDRVLVWLQNCLVEFRLLKSALVPHIVKIDRLRAAS
jgi:hypothetical protein